MGKTKLKSKLTQKKLAILFIGKLLSEIMFRELFGESPAKAIYRIYGKKSEKEGLKFNFKDEKVFDKIYKNLKKAKC